MPQLTTAHDALRHVLVTLSDRFEHALDGAPAGFAEFDAGAGVRPPWHRRQPKAAWHLPSSPVRRSRGGCILTAWSASAHRWYVYRVFPACCGGS